MEAIGGTYRDLISLRLIKSPRSLFGINFASGIIVIKYLTVKNLFLLSGLFALLFLSGCASSVRVFHDLDPNATFDQYKTYSFLEWTDGNARTVTEIEREKIRIAIAREIEAKGYTFQEGASDIKIELTVYFRNARRHYHHHYGFPRSNYNYIERALSVDMFEGATKKHVWHSAAVGDVGSDPQERSEELPEIAMKLFEDYPVRQDI